MGKRQEKRKELGWTGKCNFAIKRKLCWGVSADLATSIVFIWQQQTPLVKQICSHICINIAVSAYWVPQGHVRSMEGQPATPYLHVDSAERKITYFLRFTLSCADFVLQGPPGRPGLPGSDGVPGLPGTVLMLPVSSLVRAHRAAHLSSHITRFISATHLI